MAKHRRTTEKGRHRKPSADVRPGLMAAAAGGVLYAALSVSGASAAELTDEQSISAEAVGGYAEDSTGTGTNSSTEPDPYTDETDVDEKVTSDDAQPEAEAGSRYTEESYQPDADGYTEDSTGTAANSSTEPDTYTDETDVDEEVTPDDAQPEAEAGSRYTEESYQPDADGYTEDSTGTAANSSTEPDPY
ncbi:hypothetical protein, partial [Streptomyces sp. NPDC002187]|uniref:hypothetical protein n=1 Tax=Streptomyces sp. NPDC002187 TaxID=3364637 RepID=UPI0036A8BD2B